MRKFLQMCSVFCLSAFICAQANAGVNFIVQPSGGKSSSSSNVSNRPTPKFHTCLKKGYELRSCPSGSFAADRCPDNQSFFKKCCNSEVYRFSSFAQCAQYGKMPGGECGGKFSCAQ